MVACRTAEKVAALQEKDPGIHISRMFLLMKSGVQSMTYANVDLVPLVRIHLEVSGPLPPTRKLSSRTGSDLIAKPV